MKKKNKVVKVLGPVQNIRSTSEIKPLLSAANAQNYTSSAA